MANYTSKILGNAVSSINAQQSVIANISNNIANVNTQGYTRRTVNLETRSGAAGAGLNLGNGVDVAGIVRNADKFIESLLRSVTGEKAGSQVEVDMLSRAEKLFSLTGDSQTIGNTLTTFFNSINDLAANPSSLELRASVMERAQDLVTSVRSTYQALADLQTEADSRIGDEIESINTITEQVAALNLRVSANEATGNVAADERDKRDFLLKQLAEKISFSVVETSDGSVNITLPSGFPLVSGSTSRAISTTVAPSFAGGPLPPSLDGGISSYVVYDYGPAAGPAAHIDLTQLLAQGDGTVGALLRLRGFNDSANTSAFQGDGVFVELASRVESIARNLLTNFNNTYLAPDAANGNASQAADLSGTAPAIYGFFTFDNYPTGYVNANGLPDDLVAFGEDNYASQLALTFTDPSRLAAARDDNYGAAGGNPPYTFNPGDNQNLRALSALQSSSQAFSIGSFSLTGTFDDVYTNTVTRVANLSARSSTDLNVAESSLVTAQAKRDEVSSVSLDEEFTNLIRYQKAYEASAKLIRTATDLLDEILRMI